MRTNVFVVGTRLCECDKDTTGYGIVFSVIFEWNRFKLIYNRI